MRLIRSFTALAALVCLALWLTSIKRPVIEVGHIPKPQEVNKAERHKEVVIPIRMVPDRKPHPTHPKRASVQKRKQKPAEQTSPAKKVPRKKAKHASGRAVSGRGRNDPAVIASFRNLRVLDYLARMESMGARIALYDRRARDFACRLRSDGNFAGPVSTDGMSARARTLTSDFPGSDVILAKAAQRYGRSMYEIVLLLPLDLDDRLQQGIRNIIHAHGKQYEDVFSVRIRYRLLGNGLKVIVDRLETIEGSVTVDKCFAL